MKKVKQQELLFILGIGLFALLWAVVQPFNSSPDEKMRYEVAEYMYRYGRIPHGGDPQLRNVTGEFLTHFPRFYRICFQQCV